MVAAIGVSLAVLPACNERAKVENKPSIEAGKAVFHNQCSACHLLYGTDNNTLSPSIINGYCNDSFMTAFLWYPDSTVKNNAFAKDMYEVFHHAPHPSFRDSLSRQQILDITAFLKDFAKEK